MPANTNGIFTKNVLLGTALLNTGNASSSGSGTIGTDIFLLESFNVQNGGFSRRIRFIATGTVATATTLSIARLYASSVSSGLTTSGNTGLLAEVGLPVVTAAHASLPAFYFDIRLGEGIEAGQHLLVSTGATPAANTAWRVNSFGGDY